MKKPIIYTLVPFVILLLMSLRSNHEASLTQQTDEARYYFSEFNCLNITKRCDLKIAKLIGADTLLYVSSSERFGEYEEVWGKLTPINDSIFHVKCFRVVRQSETKPYHGISNDTITFYCDSNLIGRTFKIDYFNKKSELHTIYSTENRFHVDKKQFNSESEHMLVSFDLLHPLINETIELKMFRHSDIYFKTETSPQDFYIIVSESEIKTINIHSHADFSEGPKFTLKRMTNKDVLNRGRKLR